MAKIDIPTIVSILSVNRWGIGWIDSEMNQPQIFIKGFYFLRSGSWGKPSIFSEDPKWKIFPYKGSVSGSSIRSKKKVKEKLGISANI